MLPCVGEGCLFSLSHIMTYNANMITYHIWFLDSMIILSTGRKRGFIFRNDLFFYFLFLREVLA